MVGIVAAINNSEANDPSIFEVPIRGPCAGPGRMLFFCCCCFLCPKKKDAGVGGGSRP